MNNSITSDYKFSEWWKAGAPSRWGSVCSGRSGGMTTRLWGELQSCKQRDETGVELFCHVSVNSVTCLKGTWITGWKTCSLNLESFRAWETRHVKTESGDEEWEQLKAITPPGVSADRWRSCPAFHRVWVTLVWWSISNRFSQIKEDAWMIRTVQVSWKTACTNVKKTRHKQEILLSTTLNSEQNKKEVLFKCGTS